MNRTELYQKRVVDFKASAAEIQKKYETFSFIRLGFFIIGVGILIFLFSMYQLAAMAGLVLFILTFYQMVKYHDRLLHAKQIEESLVKVNEEELSFMKDDFTVFEDGREFTNPAHPYTIDMDVFGPYSFFQYVNRATTTLGKRKLANYLSHTVPEKEILARQESIAELQNELEWRQLFRAYGMTTEDASEHITELESWLEEPDIIRQNSLFKIALYVVPFLSLLGGYLWLFHLPWYLAILFFLPASYLLRTTLKTVNKIHEQTSRAGATLAYYSHLIAHLEDRSFQSEKLQQLKIALETDGKKASKRLRELAYIIRQLNVRYNAFVVLINLTGLWDLQWVYRLELWKAAQRDDLLKWFDVLAEFETISSFATIYYNRPDWIFPTISSEPSVDAQGLGHPLIAPSVRVDNDIYIPTEGHIKLVTGSNMAGKSTFLRTVGLNIVLAMAGAPVCAKKMTLPILKLYTSMRTQDALHESTSSFYAELKRLKIIIEAVEEEPNVFFLMDEILKGTNSNDRHTGSRALITQLIKSKGSGIIATHDLELGAMEAEANGAIENLCIEVAVENGELAFDYKIKPGVSKSFNATLLMREMGIKV